MSEQDQAQLSELLAKQREETLNDNEQQQLTNLMQIYRQGLIQKAKATQIAVERKLRNLNLFKFTDELQSRLDELSQKRKASKLTKEDEAELTGILELDRIFTLLNARIIAENDH